MELSAERREKQTHPQEQRNPEEDTRRAAEEILGRTVRVARHAVQREFVQETVILNLKTGTYHGLNPEAGRMLEVLCRSSTVQDAAELLAREQGVSRVEMQMDLLELVDDLLGRDLVELADGRAP